MEAAQALTEGTVRLADVDVKFIAQDIPLEFPQPFQPFLVQDDKADVCIRVHYGPLPQAELGKKLFDTGSFWKLHQCGGKYVFSFVSPAFGSLPYSQAIVNRDFTDGDLYFRRMEESPRKTVCPVSYPFDELIFVNHLAQGKGVDIHACGVNQEGRGLAFVGVSGAGKSTTARLWQKRQVPVLCDDRIIIRNQTGHFVMYGTPWHGDVRASLPGSVSLQGLYFLRQSPQNYLLRLSPGEAVRRLLVRCFPPFYIPSGMEFTLAFMDEISRHVPCYEFGFLPDDSAIEMVANHVAS